MSIYEAIFNRCSVREYEMEKLAPGRLEALERYLKDPWSLEGRGAVLSCRLLRG